MDEVKIETLDLIIQAVMSTIYNSEMTDEECDIVIENVFEELSDMLFDEYKEELGERLFQAEEELNNDILLHGLMEEIGWESGL